MVAKDPLFGHWTVKKFSATVVDDIWPEVTFFTLVATGALYSVITTMMSYEYNASRLCRFAEDECGFGVCLISF